MKISAEWHKDQFNVALASGEGREPFITIKGCRIGNGRNGEFVSWPARKLESGSYWNHVYASEAFNVAVLDAAKASMPAQRPKDERYRAGAADDMGDVPF